MMRHGNDSGSGKETRGGARWTCPVAGGLYLVPMPRLSLLARLGLDRAELRAWAMYDWAASSMQTTIMVAVFTIYFVKVAGAQLVQSRATQQLATVNTVALVLIAVASPILGAASDYSGKKKPLLAAFMGVGVAAVAGLFFVHTGDLALASWLFILALIGVTALALQAVYESLGRHRWSAAHEWLTRPCQRALIFLSDHPAVVVVLCALSVPFSLAGLNILPAGLSGREPTSAFYPFNPSIFALFVYLPMLGLPIAASVAVLFGWIHAIRHFRRFAGVALSLFILVRAYFAAEDQYFEMGRYMSYILPAILFLALFGKQELDHIAAQRCTPAWRRAGHIAYLMAWFTLPLPGLYEFYVRPGFDPHGGFAQVLLDRNTQREVRYLMALTENNPQCVFVGRVVQDDHGDPKVATQYSYVVFGAPVSQPVMVSEDAMPLSRVISQHASNGSCVRLYFGGDCNLGFTDRCATFIAGRRLVDQARFWSRPYNNYLQAGFGAPEIVLATYAWP